MILPVCLPSRKKKHSIQPQAQGSEKREGSSGGVESNISPAVARRLSGRLDKVCITGMSLCNQLP